CNTNLPLSTNEFSKKFARCKVASLIDFFSRYNQVKLDIKSRDLTTFQTPLGLLRQTTLPIEATNLVAQFVRIVTKILEDLIPKDYYLFIDNIRVKGPYSTYKDKEVCLEVCRYIIEHI